MTGQSNIVGHDTSSVTTLILKGTNFCPPANPACSGGKAHFDIAAPGFDFAVASLSNSCSEREPSELSGFGAMVIRIVIVKTFLTQFCVMEMREF